MKLKFAWWMRLTRFTGMTLPPFGVYLNKKKYEAMSDERRDKLIKHEHCHWLQYERLGFWRTYVGYLVLSFKHGYRNNPREVEARAYANQPQ